MVLLYLIFSMTVYRRDDTLQADSSFIYFTEFGESVLNFLALSLVSLIILGEFLKIFPKSKLISGLVSLNNYYKWFKVENILNCYTLRREDIVFVQINHSKQIVVELCEKSQYANSSSVQALQVFSYDDPALPPTKTHFSEMRSNFVKLITEKLIFSSKTR